VDDRCTLIFFPVFHESHPRERDAGFETGDDGIPLVSSETSADRDVRLKMFVNEGAVAGGTCFLMISDLERHDQFLLCFLRF
jgi:hypothetical protein